MALSVTERGEAISANDRSLVFLVSETIVPLLQWEDVIDRLRRAYSTPHAANSIPPRAVARGSLGWLRTMSAIPPESRFMGAKVFGIGPKRMVNYAIVLVEQDSGRIVAIVDGAAITALRTAATSALAIDRLAKTGPIRLGVLGSGVEAQAHVAAAAQVRPLSRVAVYSPTKTRRDSFAESMGKQLSVECVAANSALEAAEGVDVLIAAARSRDESPILTAEMLRPGMLSISIGSTLPEQREVAVGAITGCDLIICDAVEEVLNETGDMLAVADAGLDVRDRVVSLNALMSQQCDKRVSAANQIMFKSVGSALQDVVIAELAYEKALAAGLLGDSGAIFYTKHV